jgi:ATP-binding cassette subfamily B protein
MGGGPMGGMGMPVQKAKDFKGTLAKLGAYLKPHKKAMIAVFLVSIAGTVFMIFGPKILGQATTALFEGIMGKMMGIPGAAVDFGYIVGILGALLGLYAVSAAAGYAQQWVMAGIAQKTVYQMRKDVREKLDRLPLKYFDGRPHGEILSRVTNDIDLVSTTLSQSLAQVVSSVVTIVGVLVMMLTISPLLTLVGVVTLPVAGLITGFVMKSSRKHFADQQKHLGEITGHVEEMFGGHRIVKAFGREEFSVTKFEESNEALYASAWKAQFVSGLVMPLMNVVNNLGYVAVAVAGGVMAAQRTLALGDIQAFIQYLRQFTMPIVQTANIANIIQSTVASAERVFEVLSEPEEEADPERPALPAKSEGAVEIEGLSFRYAEDKPLIEGLSVRAEPGHVIAIVGPTGAGKTTLVNLLMRFYEARGGRIMIDGVDARAMRRADLRRRFGMVLQDAWLFSGTIRDNIAFGREGATEEEILEAAKAAHADHFIRTLPEGYGTRINEEASNLSQGQKQLLTIARAILADPEILILDEATSSVDTRTEMYIQNAMLALMKARTSFVIAHRLSTIREAQHILVMNEGSIVEQGTHAELLAKKGFYAELYKSQFEGG